MKRGEIWTLQDKKYASKARPVVIIQDDKHNYFDSIILCLFTTYDSSDVDTRVYIKPSTRNGLLKDSYVMTDKIVKNHSRAIITLLGENGLRARCNRDVSGLY